MKIKNIHKIQNWVYRLYIMFDLTRSKFQYYNIIHCHYHNDRRWSSRYWLVIAKVVTKTSCNLCNRLYVRFMSTWLTELLFQRKNIRWESQMSCRVCILKLQLIEKSDVGLLHCLYFVLVIAMNYVITDVNFKMYTTVKVLWFFTSRSTEGPNISKLGKITNIKVH